MEYVLTLARPRLLPAVCTLQREGPALRRALGPWEARLFRASGYVIFCAGLAGVLLLGRMLQGGLLSQDRHGRCHRWFSVTVAGGIHC